RVVGVHNSLVFDDPATGVDNATATSFFASDRFDPLNSPLDDRPAIYNGSEVVFTQNADTDSDDAIVTSYGGLVPPNSFALGSPVPIPTNNEPFRVELSGQTIF